MTIELTTTDCFIVQQALAEFIQERARTCPPKELERPNKHDIQQGAETLQKFQELYHRFTETVEIIEI